MQGSTAAWQGQGETDGRIFFPKSKEETEKKCDQTLNNEFLGSHFDNEFSFLIHCLMVAALQRQSKKRADGTWSSTSGAGSRG